MKSFLYYFATLKSTFAQKKTPVVISIEPQSMTGNVQGLVDCKISTLFEIIFLWLWGWCKEFELPKGNCN